MARPKTTELTERELEVMHVFWNHGELTANDARELLAKTGIDRAYVTVANLIRILVDKKYLKASNDERPFIYVSIRSFDDVSKSFVGDLVKRVFQGSREAMLVQLLGRKKKLTASEKAFLQNLLEEQE
ncbi:Penicillinase repressor [Rubripirellula lacrimiformis]|uniref:Penicillinase repressor n=1 Tax=Rubripirellula lacrimiformis TaxID=1930273 RepID=A0A517NIV0_9BACT|nr:BlaI/MecI/CopY family transcriptional regulator [Rubripirellula lacrimiformis]QDT07067.1 Penicillinase repressor [Rubripirellula lacrimiformis]